MGSYLYNVEHHILIETVEDAFCDAIVAPCPVDQQELLQIAELRRGKLEKKMLGIKKRKERLERKTGFK